MENDRIIEIKSLKLQIKKEGRLTVMYWEGESDEKDPSQRLVPFFNEFIDEIDGALRIVFNKLSYMNSSTIHPLVMFIKTLNERKINTELTYDKDSNWQAASFRALDSLTKVLTYIKVTGT